MEIKADEPGVAKLVFEGKSGSREEVGIHNFDGPGVIQGMHNTDKSIASFAHSCFKYAIDTRQDLWFATKDTISKKYDARFRKIFEDIKKTEELVSETVNNEPIQSEKVLKKGFKKIRKRFVVTTVALILLVPIIILSSFLIKNEIDK